MTYSKTIAAFLTAGLIGLFSFGTAQAIQPAKQLGVEAGSFLQKVDHHGKCFVWKKDSYGNKYCYKYRYKVCSIWKKDIYGTKYCFKWKWAHYLGKAPVYEKKERYKKSYDSSY